MIHFGQYIIICLENAKFFIGGGGMSLGFLNSCKLVYLVITYVIVILMIIMILNDNMNMTSYR